VEDRKLLERRGGDDLFAHAARIGDEFLQGFEAVERIDRPAVSLFGSARVREGHPAYEEAREVAGASPRPGSRSSRAAGRA